MRILTMILGMALASAMAVVPATAGQSDAARFEIELEAGPVWQANNKVEIPNDGSATRFSLEDLAGGGPWAAGRVYFSWNINSHHGIRVLLAPLSYTETGVLEQPVLFAGESFDAGLPTEGTYQFNSWRVTYRYRFHDGERWKWWVGATAKIRDAKIELKQGAVTSRDTDLGFVPLLYLRGDYRFSRRWRFLSELDALGGGPGRAVDLSLKLGYDMNENWGLAFGYRTVEGGADVDDVYSFAWFNYAVASASYRW